MGTGGGWGFGAVTYPCLIVIVVAHSAVVKCYRKSN